MKPTISQPSTAQANIKYKIDDEGYVCATTLIGEQYPLDKFSCVYHGRWD